MFFKSRNNPLIELKLYIISNIELHFCHLIHLKYTYAIGIALGRIYFAYGEHNFGNPNTMTDTKR